MPRRIRHQPWGRMHMAAYWYASSLFEVATANPAFSWNEVGEALGFHRPECLKVEGAEIVYYGYWPGVIAAVVRQCCLNNCLPYPYRKK